MVIVTVNGDHYRAMLNEFLFTKMKTRIWATFGCNRTVLLATQPKLHLMFWARFLKIALSAAELMSFGHLSRIFLKKKLFGRPCIRSSFSIWFLSVPNDSTCVCKSFFLFVCICMYVYIEHMLMFVFLWYC